MKITSYFSHDSNSRNDEKIIALRIKHGWEGYGLYWAIIEKLRESSDYQLSVNYNLLAFDLRTDNEKIKSIVTGFGLFTIEDDFFYSKSLCDRMLIKDEASDRARKKALKRWGQNDEALQLHEKNDATALLQQPKNDAKKVKESKGKKESDAPSEEIKPPKPALSAVMPSNYSRPPSAPTLRQVEECFARLGKMEEAKGFYDYYEGLNWHKGITPIINWASFANRWVAGDKPQNQNNGTAKATTTETGDYLEKRKRSEARDSQR